MLQPAPCPWVTSLTLLAGPAASREHTLDGPNVGCAACSPGHLSGWHRAHLQGDLPGPGWQFQVIYILPLGGLLGGGGPALLSPLFLSTTTCLWTEALTALSIPETADSKEGQRETLACKSLEC